MTLQQKIAEEKRADVALRQSEKKYRELFEQSPVGIFRTTSTGRIVFVNPAMVRIIGASSPRDVVEKFQDLSRDLYADPNRRVAMIAQVALFHTRLGKDRIPPEFIFHQIFSFDFHCHGSPSTFSQCGSDTASQPVKDLTKHRVYGC